MLNLLMKEGLKTAYESAGQAFVGQLAQKFVVLNSLLSEYGHFETLVRGRR